MASSKVAEWRREQAEQPADVLVATVGGNPVPVALSARCLLRDGGRLVLVHTETTNRPAERLRTILAADGFDVRLLEVAAGSPREIHGHCLQHLPGLLAGAGPRVVVDYTGGTKAMSVFAYQAVRECVAQPWSAYIDARSRSVQVAGLDEGQDAQLEVGQLPLLNLNDLLHLHGWRVHTPDHSRRRPQLPGAAKALAGDFSLAWSTFASEVRKRREWRDWDRAGGPRWPRRDAAAVVEAIEAETGLDLGDLFDPRPLVECGAFGSARQVCDWIGGCWLEHRVLDDLLHSGIAWHDRPRLGTQFVRSPGAEPFELDIVTTVGYTLVAVSCTTDRRKPTCKQKLFEVRQRASQLGGAEHKVVLVCGASAEMTEQIRDEVAGQLGRQEQPLVIGRERWVAIGDTLRAWLDR